MLLKWVGIGLFFMNIDKTVIKETKYVASFVLILSVLMQAIFLILSAFDIVKWDYTIPLGNLYGAALAIGNFFAMAFYVARAVSKEEKDAKQMVKASQSLRFVALLLLAAVGAMLPCFNVFTVVIPLVFPTIAAFLSQLRNKKK